MTARAISVRVETLGNKAHECKYDMISSLLVSYSHVRFEGAEKSQSVPDRIVQCLTHDLYNTIAAIVKVIELGRSPSKSRIRKSPPEPEAERCQATSFSDWLRL